MPGLLDQLPIWTPRLCLRLFTKADGDALFAIQRDPLLTRYAGGTRSRDESEASLRRIIDRTTPAGFGPLAIEELLSGEVIGWCGVQQLAGAERYEVIYALRVSCWGRGYATEAASAVMSRAFSLTTPDIASIWALVYPQNMRSIRVLEKLGMELFDNQFHEETNRHASLYVVERETFAGVLRDRDFTPPQSSTNRPQ